MLAAWTCLEPMGRRMVLYVVLVLFLTLSIVPPSHNHIVSLLPDDPIVEEEDELVLTCTFNCSSCRPFFTYGPGIQLPADVQHLTGNILQLRMKVNMTFNSVTFYCDDAMTMQEGQYLQVVEAPKNVSTWSALATSETLYVNWTLNNDPDSVRVSWSPDYGGNIRNNCSYSSKEFCLLNGSDFQNSPEYFLTINVTNWLNTSAVSFIQIKTETFAKPEPIESFKSTVLTSTSVNLEWAYMYHFDGFFVSQCNHENHNYTKTTSSHNVSFGDLKPFTNYSCCVHVNYSSSIYISERKCLVATTLEDKPTKGPNMRGYSVDRCQHGKRNVYIYIEAPDKEDRNGILNGCSVRVMSMTTLYTSACSPFTSTFRQTLQCNETFNISINMSTTGGFSPSAFLRVLKQNVSASAGLPMMSSGLLLLKDKVIMYCASCGNWSMYWCKGSNFNCMNPLQERIVEGSNWTSVVPVNRTDVQDILIGSSSKVPSQSNEIVWTNCVLDLTKDKVNLKLESEKINFLKVRWFLWGLDCSVGSIVGSFLVEYCSNICVNRTIESTEREMLISNLEGQVAYRVRVTYVTVDGRTGQWSDQGVQTVKGVDWKQWTMIIVSCSIVSIVVIAICVLRLIWTKLSHRFDIVTPDIPPCVDESSQLNSSSGSGGVTDLTESSPLVSETENHWTSSPSPARAAGSVGKQAVSNESAVEEYSDYSKFHIKGVSSGEDEAILMDSIQPKVILCDQTESPHHPEDRERGDFTDDSSVCPYIIAGSDMT